MQASGPEVAANDLPPVPYYEGYVAAAQGCSILSGCSHPPFSVQRQQWQRGHNDYRNDTILGALRAAELKVAV